MNTIKKAVSSIFFAIITVMLVSVLFTTSFGSKNPVASVGTSEGSVRVDGLVQNPLSLTFDELKAMPTTSVSASLYCVGSPDIPIAQGNWTGVKLSVLLGEARISAGAMKIAFFASDGYATDLTMTTGMRGNVIVAYELDNESLPELRLVVPGEWGYKWISALNHIEIVNYDFKGTYESVGYSDDASI